MKITTVLFDLDGTLLPMEQDVFIKAYMGALAKKLAPRGYSADELVRAVWLGMEAMIKNDGERTNEERFWDEFARLLGERVRADFETLEDFYRNDFDKVSAACGYNAESAKAVKTAKALGLRTVLATNPVFPRIATECRIRWAGLSLEDFEYITTYENSRYTKPNLDYYRDILEKIDTPPQRCLMVGNDVCEDMVARKLGMRVFLLSDNLINKGGEDISAFPHGSFPELNEYMSALSDESL